MDALRHAMCTSTMDVARHATAESRPRQVSFASMLPVVPVDTMRLERSPPMSTRIALEPAQPVGTTIAAAPDGEQGWPVPASPPTSPAGFDVDTLIQPHLEAAVASLEGTAPLLSGMARYHLGDLNEALAPLPPEQTGAARGKRMRPAVALLSCAAAGGDPRAAGPVAAAIELLHQFTLVHDDIQDESPTRRHRPTLWRVWGVGQAINAGDALFAAAHLALFRLRETGASPELTLRIAEEFDRMTVRIVEGQVLDLDFEGRPDITSDDYLGMIARKTSAIVRFAAWAGALLGSSDEATAEGFAAFGLALGLGFQVRDDALGIWGTTAATGKAAADDIRRRKQSLPVLLLRDRVDAATRAELGTLFAGERVDEAGVRRVLDLLARFGVQADIEARIAGLHDEARMALLAAARPGPNPPRDLLVATIDGLAFRNG